MCYVNSNKDPDFSDIVSFAMKSRLQHRYIFFTQISESNKLKIFFLHVCFHDVLKGH